MSIRGPVSFKFEYNWFKEGTTLEFENFIAYVPKNYDLILKKIYGNYMKLPPLEKRDPTHDYIAYRKEGEQTSE